MRSINSYISFLSCSTTLALISFTSSVAKSWKQKESHEHLKMKMKSTRFTYTFCKNCNLMQFNSVYNTKNNSLWNIFYTRIIKIQIHVFSVKGGASQWLTSLDILVYWVYWVSWKAWTTVLDWIEADYCYCTPSSRFCNTLAPMSVFFSCSIISMACFFLISLCSSIFHRRSLSFASLSSRSISKSYAFHCSSRSWITQHRCLQLYFKLPETQIFSAEFGQSVC